MQENLASCCLWHQFRAVKQYARLLFSFVFCLLGIAQTLSVVTEVLQDVNSKKERWMHVCTHHIIVSRACKGSPQLGYLPRGLVDDDDITSENHFFGGRIDHFRPQVIHGLHILWFNSQLSRFCCLSCEKGSEEPWKNRCVKQFHVPQLNCSQSGFRPFHLQWSQSPHGYDCWYYVWLLAWGLLFWTSRARTSANSCITFLLLLALFSLLVVTFKGGVRAF